MSNKELSLKIEKILRKHGNVTLDPSTAKWFVEPKMIEQLEKLVLLEKKEMLEEMINSIKVAKDDPDPFLSGIRITEQDFKKKLKAKLKQLGED